MAVSNRIDSNASALRIAEEDTDCIGILPSETTTDNAGNWVSYLPNSYSDLGFGVETVSRRGIEPGRQKRKGRLVNLTAGGGFNIDLTQNNLQALMKGALVTDIEENSKNTPVGVDGTNDEYDLTALAVSATVAAGGTSGYVVDDVLTTTGGTGTAATFTVTAVAAGVVTAVTMTTAGAYTAVPGDPVTMSGGSGTGTVTLNVLWDTEDDYYTNDLVFGENFTEAANNGLKLVDTGPTENTIPVTTSLTAEVSPPSNAKLWRVGHQFAAGDLDVDASGTLPTLTTTSKDLTELGISPGEWIFLGGDTAATRFTTTDASGNLVNTGWCRVRTVSANAMELDLTEFTMQTEASTAETVQLFLGGEVMHNQALLSNQQRHTYRIERELGEDDNGPQAEYFVGEAINTVTGNFPLKDKVNFDFAFQGLDHATRNGSETLRSSESSATRTGLLNEEPFNTAGDISYRMAVYTEGTTAPTPLFAYIDALTLNINNNISRVEVLGADGAVDLSYGGFDVTAEITAIFETVDSLDTIRNVDDVTINWRLVKENAGVHYDLPLLTLQSPGPDVAPDSPVKLPVTSEGATGASIDSTALDHTLMITYFPYLPTLAA